MSTYDYKCDTNGKVLEVNGMSELLTTWGELRARSGHDPSDTASDSPVTRLANGGQIVKRSNRGDSVLQGCDTGPCCGGGLCV